MITDSEKLELLKEPLRLNRFLLLALSKGVQLEKEELEPLCGNLCSWIDGIMNESSDYISKK
jgi:hypothetical protein